MLRSGYYAHAGAGGGGRGRGSAQLADQLGGVDGLDHDLEAEVLRFGFGEELTDGGLAGEQEDAQAGEQLAEVHGRIDAVAVAKEEIGDENVGLELGGGFKRVAAGIDGLSFKSTLIEDENKGIGDELLVVGDENFGLTRNGHGNAEIRLRLDLTQGEEGFTKI